MDTPVVYIVGAARTPVAQVNGPLSQFSAAQLGAAAIQGAMKRSRVPPELVSHVYMGHALQAGCGQSPSKQAAIYAGLSETIEATTINKVCASGLKAVTLAAQEILLGLDSVRVAGGMESMSNVPSYVDTKFFSWRGKGQNGVTKDGLLNPYDGLSMGACADLIAARFELSKESQDEYALASFKRASQAVEMDVFREEVVPVPYQPGGSGQVSNDDIRGKALFQRLKTLNPAFSAAGTITGGTSCTIADGASAVVLTNAQVARQHCKENSMLARIVSFADAAAKPKEFSVAPAKAAEIALERAKLAVDDISLWEINEAFAAVVLINQKVRRSWLGNSSLKGDAG
ncbi:acetyl-CoA C-acetyltransferase [Ophiocordyceps camponoti-floridani]|uniref:Acetyl-CoA C-acetyltransferase n=1 Tax=Ophiocordyceps camponoti-floridani TaxID=2030778 RepID=A0A8H4Q2R3_9HYPO|nr:acetyl-CoA C-acetyltransferase [Ophiocordyceps camponoti-floridani]